MDKLDSLYTIEQIHKYSSITYMDGDIQLWCIKSPVHFSKIVDIEPYIGEPSNIEQENTPIKKDESEKKEQSSMFQ